MAIDMTFPDYFIVGMMERAGWPREEGRFRKKQVLSLGVLSSTFTQLNRIGITLGAGAPVVAAELLTDAFSNRDWANTSIHDLFDRFDPQQKILENSDRPPWQALNPISFEPESTADIQRTVPWDFLSENETKAAYIGGYFQGLIWGLKHNEDAKALVDSEAAEEAVLSKDYQQYGLQIDEGVPSSFEEWLENAMGLVEGYIALRGELPEVEPTMFDYPLIAARLSE